MERLSITVGGVAVIEQVLETGSAWLW